MESILAVENIVVLIVGVLGYFLKKEMTENSSFKKEANDKIQTLETKLEKVSTQTEHNKNILEVAFNKDVENMQKIFEARIDGLDSKVEMVQQSMKQNFEILFSKIEKLSEK